jgi:hypothetical protein
MRVRHPIADARQHGGSDWHWRVSGHHPHAARVPPHPDRISAQQVAGVDVVQDFELGDLGLPTASCVDGFNDRADQCPAALIERNACRDKRLFRLGGEP